MTDIKNTRAPSPLELEVRAQQQQQTAEMEAEAVKVATRSRTVAAVGDVHTTETAPAGLAADITLPAPQAPKVSMGADAVAGAQSFSGQLYYAGGSTDDADVLLARFLKLQVLTETEDLWSQLLAREAQSLLMQGAIAMAKTGVRDAAESHWASAKKLQQQALALLAAYEISNQGENGGGLASLLRTPVLRYANESFTATQSASEDLKQAVSSLAAAETAEQNGDLDTADQQNAEATAALDRYLASPSRAGDVLEFDGKLYDIGAMDRATLIAAASLLAQADYHLQRGHQLNAAYAQGVGASQMRKGQHMIDSFKRLEGHDIHLDAVMQAMAGTTAADKKRESLSLVDQQRLSVASLLAEGAGNSESFARNKLQPVQG